MHPLPTLDLSRCSQIGGVNKRERSLTIFHCSGEVQWPRLPLHDNKITQSTTVTFTDNKPLLGIGGSLIVATGRLCT
jgi:hypothetical protein